MNPVFQVGDEVEFELQNNGRDPRWDFDKDTGGSGKWGTGIVEFVNDRYIDIKYSEGIWSWPHKEHGQWDRPGYMRKKSVAQASVALTSPAQEPPCRCKGPVGIHDGSCEYYRWNRKRLSSF